MLAVPRDVLAQLDADPADVLRAADPRGRRVAVPRLQVERRLNAGLLAELAVEVEEQLLVEAVERVEALQAVLPREHAPPRRLHLVRLLRLAGQQHLDCGTRVLHRRLLQNFVALLSREHPRVE